MTKIYPGDIVLVYGTINNKVYCAYIAKILLLLDNNLLLGIKINHLGDSESSNPIIISPESCKVLFTVSELSRGIK